MGRGEWLELEVVAVSDEAEGIRAAWLGSPDGRPLPSWEAGAHVELESPCGTFRRPFSLCNDPAEPQRYRVAIQREPSGRGGSRAIHEALRVGARLRVLPPKNGFPLGRPARALLVAGGIGLTPLLSMARVLSRAGTPFALHVCTRSPERTPFRAELLEGSLGPAVHLHHDAGDRTRGLDLAKLLASRDGDTHLYCCGPNALMQAVREAALAAGWPLEALHFESFSATPVDPLPDDEGFELELRRSARTLRVGPGQSVLQAIRGAGVQVMSDCEAGTCGTCLTNVLAGEPDHHDFFLTEEERSSGRCMLVCVSRARGKKLVLDA